MIAGLDGHRALQLTTESEQGSQESGEKVSPKRLLKLLEKQGMACAESGIALTPKTATLDHKIALSRGGSRTMENVQIVHEEVNRMKGTLSHDRFVELCRAVAAWNG